MNEPNYYKIGELLHPQFAIARFHAAYEQCTGIQLPLNGAFKREYEWGAWMAHGWTEADLRLVIAYLRRHFSSDWQSGRRDYFFKMVRFSRLISDHEYFEEWLALARAEARNVRLAPTERQRVLEATGRQEPSAKDAAIAKPAGQVAQEVLQKGYENILENL